MFTSEGIGQSDPSRERVKSLSRGGHPEVPPPGVHDAVMRVNEPVMGAARVINRELRIQYTGRPRVGATRRFMEIWRGQPDRPDDLTMMEIVTSTPTPDTATTTYIFSCPTATSDACLKRYEAFAQRVVAEFEAGSGTLYTPVDMGRDYRLSVQVAPDGEGQLKTVLNAFETFAQLHGAAQRINVRELIGRREVDETGGHFAELSFVLGFPEELERHAPGIKGHIEQTFAERRGKNDARVDERCEVTFVGPDDSDALPDGTGGCPPAPKQPATERVSDEG